MPPFNAVEKIAKNLRKPSTGFFGWYVRKGLSLNKPLERNAVKLLKIEPHHNVLEVGFGPGHGIQYVFDGGFRSGIGKIYGVDFSPTMCEYTKKRFPKEIESKTLIILNEDVAKMSLQDCYFDKVFHTNSHLYWPDLPAACAELYRVMKPGADMATVMNLFRLKHASAKTGAVKFALNLSPESYIDALKSSGFVDIELRKVNRPFLPSLDAIICHKK